MGAHLSCPCTCSRQQTRSEEMVQCNTALEDADACTMPHKEAHVNELVAGPMHRVASAEYVNMGDTSKKRPKDLFVNVHVTDGEQDECIQVFTELSSKSNRVDIMVKDDGTLFFNYDMCGQIRRHSM